MIVVVDSENIWLAFRLRAQPKLDASFDIHGVVELEASGGEDLVEGVSHARDGRCAMARLTWVRVRARARARARVSTVLGLGLDGEVDLYIALCLDLEREHLDLHGF